MKHLLRHFCVISILFTLPAALAEEAELDPEKFRMELPVLGPDRVTVSEQKQNEAEEFYRQALESAKNRQGYAAMRFIVQVLLANPDHVEARKVLNFRLHEGKWRTDWEIRQIERGAVEHPEFGWMPGDFVERYENGRRYYAKEKRWVDADEDARLHFDMQNAWVISTEHYDIRTNHSWEEGVRTARQLEHLNRAWRLLFFNMVFTEDRLARIILEPPRVAPKEPRHRVLVYRNQGDYNANLKAVEPQIERTNGFYHPGRATAYFFPVAPDMDEFEAENTRKSMFHEATHQLFQEAKSHRNMEPPKTNFWVTEGVAMLMETFRIEKNRYFVGDIEDTRLYAAKIYKERDNFFISSVRLTRYGATDYPKQLESYAQSAGMTHFLMFAHEARDRDALLELLRKTYDGSVRADTLRKLLDRPFEQFDKEYIEFLRDVP